MVQNKALVFLEVADGWPIIGKNLAVQDIGFDPSAPAPAGGVTVELLYASFDPYLRGRMGTPSSIAASDGFELGKPMDNFSIARILKSDVASFSPGDLVRHCLPIAQYSAISAAQMDQGILFLALEKLSNPHNLDIKHFIGPLGMPGLTAYSSLYEIAKPKRGETIVVSAASGAVGQMVGQLAKREGLRVIGSVGSQAKLDYIVNELGFDGGFNYKTENASEALARLAPKGVDIYFDNVGGEQLDAALAAANNYSRFIISGAISQYSKRTSELYGVKNTWMIDLKRIRMQGFVVLDDDYGVKWGEKFYQDVGGAIARGEIKVSFHVTTGIENAAEGFLGLLGGENFGKAVLEVKAP